MKRILFLFLPFLPYLATAQVAKDTVTVLTPAQITAASPNDTANIYFVIANAWRKANFDSIARYTRNRFQTLTLDSTHIAANGLSLQGTELTGTLPISRGGTGLTSYTTNGILYASNATTITNSSNLIYNGTNLGLGGVSSPGSRLVIQGSDNLSGASSLNVTNSSASSLLFVRNDGRVGIGTTSPNARLDVRGFAEFRGANPGMTIFPTASGVDMYFYQSQNPTIYLQSGDDVVFNTGFQVGIGVTTPTSLLEVNGIASFGDGSASAPSLTNTGDLNTGMWFPAAETVGISTNGTERMRIKENGQVRFIPLAAAPGSPELGDVYYDSGTHKLRVYAKVGGTDQWVDLH